MIEKIEHLIISGNTLCEPNVAATLEQLHEKQNEIIDAVNSLTQSVARLLVAHPRVLRELDGDTAHKHDPQRKANSPYSSGLDYPTYCSDGTEGRDET